MRLQGGRGRPRHNVGRASPPDRLPKTAWKLAKLQRSPRRGDPARLDRVGYLTRCQSVGLDHQFLRTFASDPRQEPSPRRATFPDFPSIHLSITGNSLALSFARNRINSAVFSAAGIASPGRFSLKKSTTSFACRSSAKPLAQTETKRLRRAVPNRLCSSSRWLVANSHAISGCSPWAARLSSARAAAAGGSLSVKRYANVLRTS